VLRKERAEKEQLLHFTTTLLEIMNRHLENEMSQWKLQLFILFMGVLFVYTSYKMNFRNKINMMTTQVYGCKKEKQISF
jgi:hypothetical protein